METKEEKTARRFKQTRTVSWLNTPKDTFWESIPDNPFGIFIQPEDESLRTTILGVHLGLLDEKDLTLFEEIPTIEI